MEERLLNCRILIKNYVRFRMLTKNYVVIKLVF